MNVLIVVAHPDDEVLGCGMAGPALVEAGHTVRACFLVGRAEARGGRPSDDGLTADMQRAQSILGFGAPILGDFPNIRLNTVPHLDLVQFVEGALLETGAEMLFTHHPADVNDDHLQVSRACQAALRLSQRRPDVAPVRSLHYMEILSSTDWALPGGAALFTPNLFVDGTGRVDRKLEAMRAYGGVMRNAPHPRSEPVIRGLASYRGAQSGQMAAEAFQCVFTAGNVAQVFGE